MSPPDFIRKPQVALAVVVGAAGLISLVPLLGFHITHDDAEITGLILGGLAVISGLWGLVSAILEWAGTRGASEGGDLLRAAGVAVVVIAVGGFLVWLGVR